MSTDPTPATRPKWANSEDGRKLLDRIVSESQAGRPLFVMPEKRYKSAATGNLLQRRFGQFYYRGREFHGLVDAEDNALYDDPEDSFAAFAGIPSSLSQGLILREEAQDA